MPQSQSSLPQLPLLPLLPLTHPLDSLAVSLIRQRAAAGSGRDSEVTQGTQRNDGDAGYDGTGVANSVAASHHQPAASDMDDMAGMAAAAMGWGPTSSLGYFLPPYITCPHPWVVFTLFATEFGSQSIVHWCLQ